MATGIKKFNWLQRRSTWEHVQAWNAHRREMTQRFLDEGAAAVNAFARAQHLHTAGLVANAQQVAITRLNKKA